MSVTPDDVARIAQLAELHLDQEEMPALVGQMSRILDYVAQLGQVQVGEGAKPFVLGPDAIRCRPDEVKPWPLAFGPSEFAPVFKSGFFVVPRLGQFGDEGSDE